MTQEQILEFNKRCAEFLGMYDYSIDNEYFEKEQYYCYPERDRNPRSGYFTVVQVTDQGYVGLFNFDWNWIHKIIEAIEKVNFTEIEYFNCFTFMIEGNRCTINVHPQFTLAFDKLSRSFRSSNQYIVGLSKKEAVIEVINQFLIWYNENKVN